jgi:cytochrome c biogenesis DsbD-like protein
MKRVSLIGYCLLIGIAVSAQKPVKWNFFAKKVNDKTFELHLVAQIQDGWHIYSQTTPKGGPHPTVIQFSKNPLTNLSGKIKEQGELKSYFEDAFGVTVKKFTCNKVEFIQLVNLKSAKIKTNIVGTVEYMACTDEMCMPPATEKFEINLTE